MHSFLPKSLILGCWFFLTFTVHAEVLRWPQICDTGLLQIKNETHRPIEVWLQKFAPGLVDETQISLPANSIHEVKIENKLNAATYSVLHFRKSGTVKTNFYCDNKSFPSTAFEGGQFYFNNSTLENSSLILQNLFFDKNQVHIQYLDDLHGSVKTEIIQLMPFERLNYEIPQKKFIWSSVQLQAENRFVVFSINAQGSNLADQIKPQPVSPDFNAKYFVVTDRANPVDSFTVKISNPAMIEKAREQIRNPNLEKIIFARIQKGHGQFNRNWSKPEKSFWSWSTVEVTNISDLGSTSCNGLPQAVEDRAERWISEPGQICFWSYRIKKELSRFEISTGIELP